MQDQSISTTIGVIFLNFRFLDEKNIYYEQTEKNKIRGLLYERCDIINMHKVLYFADRI